MMAEKVKNLEKVAEAASAECEKNSGCSVDA